MNTRRLGDPRRLDASSWNTDGLDLGLWSRVASPFKSDDSLLIVNRMVTKMSPLNRYFPLVGLETRLSWVRPSCYLFDTYLNVKRVETSEVPFLWLKLRSTALAFDGL